MLAHIAKRGLPSLIKTNVRCFFGVEMVRIGHECVPAMKQRAHPITHPEKPQTSPTHDGGDWADFDVDKWRSAMFTAQSFFNELFADTTEFIANLCEELGGKDSVLLVEVGCGTGEMLVPLAPHAQYVVGMDFNPHFVKFCKQNVPKDEGERMNYLVGDAQELDDLLRRGLAATWMESSRPKVVMSVGNTVGVMPPNVRQKVYQQMMHLAGPDGYMVVVYWNGNRFGDAVQNFYYKNPQLCGPFTGDCVDLATCTLTTPSGYSTHWTTPEEARQVFEQEIGAEVVHLVEKGNGVLVAGRMPGSKAKM
jgi:SAM-dependent methyltransferase